MCTQNVQWRRGLILGLGCFQNHNTDAFTASITVKLHIKLSLLKRIAWKHPQTVLLFSLACLQSLIYLLSPKDLSLDCPTNAGIGKKSSSYQQLKFSSQNSFIFFLNWEILSGLLGQPEAKCTWAHSSVFRNSCLCALCFAVFCVNFMLGQTPPWGKGGHQQLVATSYQFSTSQERRRRLHQPCRGPICNPGSGGWCLLASLGHTYLWGQTPGFHTHQIAGGLPGKGEWRLGSLLVCLLGPSTL
jgi:hypothetical protein